ncbi:MAG TPA: presqualene diphosphate synthase HpnD [Gammaproteobacteria bacterium]|nr:presqualene diphosphate synthase HpnD [Gammaproteobacteria bacterium]
MTPDQYCQEKAAASGSSFYYSFLFLPEDRRKAITALYAFCREVDDAVDECSDIGVARTKLQWWREEVARLFEGAPRHPVTQALLPHRVTARLAQEYFQEIISGMEMDLEQTTYENFEQLKLYCYRAASVVGLLSVGIFGYTNPQTLDYARDLGMAFQLTNILRDVREDAARGRIYIPAEELERFGVNIEALLQFKTTDPIRKLFEFQAQRAHGYYRSALQLLPAVDRYSQRSGLIMAAIYEKLLDEIETDGYRVLEQRISLTPLRKLWIAWSTARREKKIAKAST